MSFAARVALIALVPAAVAAAAPEPPQAIQRMMTAPIQFDLSPPLASIVPAAGRARRVSRDPGTRHG